MLNKKAYMFNSNYPGCELYRFTLNCVRVSGKSQVMGEIKIALKKEMKTEGEHLVLEILQCRNITYKFKSPDHLPGKGREKINLHIHTHIEVMSPDRATTPWLPSSGCLLIVSA